MNFDWKNKIDTSTLLTIGGGIGVIFTGIAAARGGMKHKEKKEIAEKERRELTKEEVIKCYIPAGVIGASTIFCIVKSHTMSAAEIAALTASGAYLAKNRDQLEKKLKEYVGEEKIEEIKEEFAIKTLKDAPRNKKGKILCEETGHGKTLFYIPFSGRLFRSSLEHVTNAVDSFIADRGDIDNEPVNTMLLIDLYNKLDIRPDDFSKSVYWGDEDEGFDRDIFIEVKKFNPEDDPTYGFEDLNEPVYLLDIDSYYYPMYNPNNMYY